MIPVKTAICTFIFYEIINIYSENSSCQVAKDICQYPLYYNLLIHKMSEKQQEFL